MNTATSIFFRVTILFFILVGGLSFFAIGVQADPALSLTKDAAPVTYSSVGQTIIYTFTIVNIGDVTLEGPVLVDDDKTTNEDCPNIHTVGNNDGNLDPGEEIECTASYTITQADLDAGSVTNTASASAGGTTSNSANTTVNAIQTPGLTIAKSSDAATFASVGNTINYSYQLTNNGNVTLDGPFTVTDDKVTVTCPPTATLAPGASITCNASYSITQLDLDAGSVTNTASATASFDGSLVNSLPANKTVNAQETTLTLVKAALPTTYDSVGDSITYTYTLTNYGNVVLSGPFTITDNKATVNCPFTATLDPGAFIDCSATYTIIQADLNAGSVMNTATGHASFDGGPVDSNPDSETVNAIQSPSILLTKDATQSNYKAVGNTLNYTLVATNNGNVTLENVVITDSKLGSLNCTSTTTLAPGAFRSCTGTYTITQADLDAKSVTNTANSTGKLGASTVPSNPASHTVFGATFTVNPTSGLLTSEGGTTDTFTIKLDKKPSANVVLNITSGTTSDEASVSPTTLTFTPEEWTPSLTKTVTVQGVNDNLADGPQPFTINMTNVSSGPDYSGVNPPPVTGTNGDNDTAGLAVAPLSGLITTEGKTSAKIQVKLNTQPTADVTVNFASSDLTEGTVAPASLVIKPADWNKVKEATVTGVDDKEIDGNKNYLINISTTSTDANYKDKKQSVSATNRDAPTIKWVSPVLTGQVYEINNLVPFLLKALPDSTEPITRVRFYRWDAVKNIHVNIAEIINPPYQVFYDPALLANNLNPGFNQFFAVAYNAANVASENIHFWVYKQGNLRTLYLPLGVKNK